MLIQFDNEIDVEWGVKPEHLTLIGSITHQYSRLEYFLSQSISDAMKSQPAMTSIVLGRIGTKKKFDILLKIYAHTGDDDKRKVAARLKKDTETHAYTRNVITHNPILASKASGDKKNTFLYFSSDRYVKNTDNHMMVIRLTSDELNQCAKAIHDIADDVNDSFLWPVQP